jgi:hypothetical protein
MNRSIQYRWLVVALAPLAAVFAQGISPSVSGRATALVNAARSGDDAWEVVSKFVSARTRAVGQLPIDPADPDALSQADLYIQASLAAATFQGRYPGDARARQAGKLEAVYALHGVQLGGGHFKATALSLGAAYRADKRNSAADRFEVGFLMEGLAFAESLQGKRFIDDGVKYEQLADGLLAELGDTAEVYGLYVSIVRTTDVTTATRVANRLLAMKKAPDWAKSQAQTVLDRSNLMGKPLPVKLTTMGGDQIDLSVASANPTVLYFWSAADGPNAFAALDHFKASFPRDVRWIYVAVDGEPPKSDRPMAGSPLAAMHCYQRAQAGSSLTAALQVPQAPYAFVLNRAGRVAGFGFPENIAALLQAANR